MKVVINELVAKNYGVNVEDVNKIQELYETRNEEELALFTACNRRLSEVFYNEIYIAEQSGTYQLGKIIEI